LPATVLAAGKTAPGLFEKSIQPFFSANCYSCHNSKLKSGQLDLSAYFSPESVVANRTQFEEIVRKLTAGEMPPRGVPRPPQADIQMVTAWIQGEFDRADRLVKPDPGRVVARRLNRAEYNNTIRDLLGVDFRPADDFPQDDSGYGFDNIADVLTLSPLLMEKYLSAAETVSKLALIGPDLKPLLFRHQPLNRRRLEKRAAPSTVPGFYSLTDYDLTGLSQPSSIHANYLFPAEGEYTFRLLAGGARPPGSTPVKLALWIDNNVVHTDDVLDTGQDGTIYESKIKVSRGWHWIAASYLKQFEGLPKVFGGLNPAPPSTTPPAVTRRQIPPGAPGRAGAAAGGGAAAAVGGGAVAGGGRGRGGAGAANPDAPVDYLYTADSIVVKWFEIVGPFGGVGGPSPESKRKILVCTPGEPGCERKVVANLARRAFRRPVTTAELTPYLDLALNARRQGRSFEDAVGLSLQAILVSPDFLFRIERDTPVATAAAAKPHTLNQYELASRLSYFLWSSMPDDELLACADRGTLGRPEVLDRQVKRMLTDPRSSGLAENFTGQWLETRRLESVNPDRERFPDFEDYLQDSMRREPELFFQYVMNQNRSILDFIDADYTFVNERLAHHYRIPGVTGPEFRKVDLTGTNRGGVLTQAGVLTVSSYGNRTSPVLRGKWVLENILNTPPPPPPPDVPLLNEAAVGTSASLRVQMEQHRANALCASCHSRMDPLGFALENFDAVGAWRTQDGKFPVDPSGQLPDGRKFQGVDGLKAILKSNPEAFANAFTEKLLTYALGRGLEAYDRPAVKTIVARAGADQYRFSTLVLEIVKSLPFRMRKGEGSANDRHT
jgi:hypothetical protein